MKHHPLDVFSLGAGIVFVALAAAFMAGEYLEFSVNGAVVFPALLIVLGLLGLYAAIRAQRRNDIEVESASIHDLREQDLY